MLFIALLVSVLSASPAQDEKALVLARAVPKDAFLLVQAARIDALRADFEASPWYRFYQDEELNALRGWVEKLESDAAKGQDSPGVDPLEFLRSVHGSMEVFAVMQPGREYPAMGVLIEPGEPRGAFEDCFARIVESEKREQISSSDEYDGVELTLLEKKKEVEETSAHTEASAEEEDSEGTDEETDPGTEPAKHDGLEYSVILDAGGWACMAAAATPEDLLQMVHGMIDRMNGKDPARGFEDSGALAQARASVSAPGRIEAFLDVSRVIAGARIERPPSAEEEKVFNALQLDDLRWLYACADIGKGEEVGVDLAVCLPDKGYLRTWLACLGSLPREMARMAPRESTALVLAQCDLWGIWQSAWEMAAAIDPDSAKDAKGKIEATAQLLRGADVEKDFLAQLDGRFAIFAIPIPKDEWKASLGPLADQVESLETQPHGDATLIGLRDATAVSGFVEKVLTGVGVFERVETEDFQGNTIYEFGTAPQAGLQWAFTEKAAVISQFPTAVRAALRMQGTEAKDSALEKESFKPLFEAHADASMLSFVSTADSLKNILSAVRMIGVMATAGEKPDAVPADNPLDHLPSAAAIERHFKGMLVSSLTCKGGVLHMRMGAR